MLAMTLLRTDASNEDFRTLVRALDAELAIRDGDEHAFYSQFNKIDALKHCIVVYDGAIPVGCGALKHYADGTVEIKRMYTLPEQRGRGVASQILGELQRWAGELQYQRCILETGVNQPEAIALYEKQGFHRIPNYGQYAKKEYSFCFEKRLWPMSEWVNE